MLRLCIALSFLLPALGLMSCADEGEVQTDSSPFDKHMYPIWSIGEAKHDPEVDFVVNKLVRRLSTAASNNELNSQKHILRVAGLYSGAHRELHSSVLKVRLAGINLEAQVDSSVHADFELPLSAERALITLRSNDLVEIVCEGPIERGLTPTVSNCNTMLAFKMTSMPTNATSNLSAYIRLMIEYEKSAKSGP